MKPRTRMNGSAIARKARCFSAKAIMEFMTGVGASARPRSSGLRSAVDEQTAARHDFVARLQSIQYFHHAVVDAAGVNLPQGQIIPFLHDPDSGFLALAHDGFLGNCQSIGLAAGDDAEGRKHLRFELAVLILDRGSNLDA